MAKTDAIHSGFSNLESLADTFVLAPLDAVINFDALFFVPGVKLPFVIALLIAAATYYTLRLKFINIRAFKHAIDITRGKFDDPNDPGEISHFQALSSAM